MVTGISHVLIAEYARLQLSTLYHNLQHHSAFCDKCWDRFSNRWAMQCKKVVALFALQTVTVDGQGASYLERELFEVPATPEGGLNVQTTKLPLDSSRGDEHVSPSRGDEGLD